MCAASLAARLSCSWVTCDVNATQTAPLLEYYGAQGLVVTVPGMGTIEEVFGAIVEALSTS